jgi:hypothetical protein
VNVVAIAIGIAVPVVIFGVIGVGIWWYCRKKREKEADDLAEARKKKKEEGTGEV